MKVGVQRGISLTRILALGSLFTRSILYAYNSRFTIPSTFDTNVINYLPVHKLTIANQGHSVSQFELGYLHFPTCQNQVVGPYFFVSLVRSHICPTAFFGQACIVSANSLLLRKYVTPVAFQVGLFLTRNSPGRGIRSLLGEHQPSSAQF